MQGETPRIPQKSTLVPVKVSDWDLKEKLGACNFDEKWVAVSGSFDTLCVFWFSSIVGITERQVPGGNFSK